MNKENARKTNTPNIFVEKVTTAQGLEKLRPEWHSLLERCPFPNVFLTLDWQQVWWEHFGQDRQLYVLAIREQGDLIGVAPFCLNRGQRCYSGRLEFIGVPSADYGDILARDIRVVVAAMFDYLEDHASDWSELRLTELSERSTTRQAVITEAGNRGYSILDRGATDCPTFIFGSEAERKRTPPPKLSKKRRKHLNELSREAEVRFEVARDRQSIERMLPELFHYHIKRWDETPVPSKFNLPPAREFYKHLVRRLADKHEVILFQMLRGDLPIAFFFCFQYGKVIYSYTPAINLFFSEYSPGKLLLPHVLEYCYEYGFEELDHTRGAEQYKDKYANRVFRNVGLSVYRRRRSKMFAIFMHRIRTNFLTRWLARSRMLRSVYFRVRSYLERYGFRNLLLKLVARGLKIISDSNTLLMFKHNGHVPEVSARCHIDIQILGIDDLEKIYSFLGCRPGTRKYKVILDRFSKGGSCYAAFCDGHIAATCWDIHEREYFHEVDWHFDMGTHQVFLADAETSPVYRGLRIYPELLAFAVRDRLRAGYDVYGACMADNKASYKGIKMIGFELTFKVHRLRLFGLRLK